MKILFLTDFIPPSPRGGGAARSVWRVAQELKKRGHDMFVVTSVQDKSLEGQSIQEGITLFCVYSDYPDRWRAYMSVYNPLVLGAVDKILKEIRPDIVHADNIHFYISYAALKIAWRYAKYVFLTTRDFMLIAYGKVELKKEECGKDIYKVRWWNNVCQARKRFNPLRNIFIKHYLKYVDRIFSNSNMLANFLAFNGIPGVVPNHNGLALRDVSVSVSEVEVFKQTHNLAGKNIVLFPARISPAKGLYAVMDATKKVVKKVPKSALVIVGVAKRDKEAIHMYVEEIGLQGHIAFLGWTAGHDLDIVYNTTDVVLVPSLYPDPYPTVIMESALYKKPVIATCFGGAKEFVLDGVTGYIINPFDNNLMAEKIIDLLQNQERARKFGEAAYRRLTTEFTVEKQVDKLLKYYQEG